MSDNYSDRVVLVVDDDFDTRSIVSGTVSALGVKTVEAVDGHDALLKYESEQPDIVLLDWMMPGMSGDEVCRKIREMEGGGLCPIIMLTARDSLSDKVSALEGGADDYVTKPFEYRELQARVRAQLRVRELNLELQAKNIELIETQERLVEKERQLAVGQLAGTAAHELGQPLSAIILNCHLLDKLEKSDEKFVKALGSIRSDAKRMSNLIEDMRKADASSTADYHDGTSILSLSKDEETS